MAVTWVTPHPCPFTGRAREAVGGGGRGSTTQRARNPLRGRQVPPGLGVIRTPAGTSRELRAGSACAPSRSAAPSTAGGGAPPPRPSSPPSFPSSPGLCEVCTWGGFPTAGRLSALSCSQDRARNQAARVFCVCSRGCYLRSTPAAPISTVEEASCHNRGLVTIDTSGFLFFLLGLAERFWKSCWPSRNISPALHLQPSGLPRSGALRSGAHKGTVSRGHANPLLGLMEPPGGK